MAKVLRVRLQSLTEFHWRLTYPYFDGIRAEIHDEGGREHCKSNLTDFNAAVQRIQDLTGATSIHVLASPDTPL